MAIDRRDGTMVESQRFELDINRDSDKVKIRARGLLTKDSAGMIAEAIAMMDRPSKRKQRIFIDMRGIRRFENFGLLRFAHLLKRGTKPFGTWQISGLGENIVHALRGLGVRANLLTR
jgi:anti-anti-sigma regulatory factor